MQFNHEFSKTKVVGGYKCNLGKFKIPNDADLEMIFLELDHSPIERLN